MKLDTRALVALALGLALGLTGCADDEPAKVSAPQTSTSEHNDADVEFATEMIPHHAQALVMVMVDMTLGRTLDPEFEQLTMDIRDAQGPEIELMTDWLVDWDEEIPETMRDHTNAGQHMDDDMMGELPGMMSNEDFEGLENIGDTGFQDMWLTMMIQHHEGAIEMSQTEVAAGLYQPTIELAEQIITSQTEEIALMQSMLD